MILPPMWTEFGFRQVSPTNKPGVVLTNFAGNARLLDAETTWRMLRENVSRCVPKGYKRKTKPPRRENRDAR